MRFNFLTNWDSVEFVQNLGVSTNSEDSNKNIFLNQFYYSRKIEAIFSPYYFGNMILKFGPILFRIRLILLKSRKIKLHLIQTNLQILNKMNL